jgi:hypothetical protein
MKSSTKFWLAIFTFLPIVMAILIFGFFFTSVLENIIELNENQGEFPLEFIQSFIGFIILIVIAAIISLGVKIYYIVHTNNNTTNTTNKKVMWTLILIFGGTVASIVYYFIEITPLKPIK